MRLSSRYSFFFSIFVDSILLIQQPTSLYTMAEEFCRSPKSPIAVLYSDLQAGSSGCWINSATTQSIYGWKVHQSSSLPVKFKSDRTTSKLRVWNIHENIQCYTTLANAIGWLVYKTSFLNVVILKNSLHLSELEAWGIFLSNFSLANCI